MLNFLCLLGDIIIGMLLIGLFMIIMDPSAETWLSPFAVVGPVIFILAPLLGAILRLCGWRDKHTKGVWEEFRD